MALERRFVTTLSRLAELQKVWEEVSDLQKKVTSAQSEISTLREQIDKERVEKLALKHEALVLKNNLKIRKDVELKFEPSRQLEHYDELWIAHGSLIEEVHTLHSRHNPQLRRWGGECQRMAWEYESRPRGT